MAIYKVLTILIWFQYLIGGSSAAKTRQIFANQPSPQTAVIGSTVVLPCRIINMVGELQWTRDGFGLGNERQLYAFKRYTMIGSNEEGDYSLRISPVTLEDDAQFQCQVTGWRDIPGVRSSTAKLSVRVHPERPVILQGPVVKTTAGKSIRLECLSKGGKPAAELLWLDSSRREISEGVKYTKELLKDGHRYDARSVLTFVAQKEHHNTEFTCSATNPALNEPYKTQVRIEVTYAPVVSVDYDKQDGYKEGDPATLRCSALANPHNLSFRWYKNGNVVSSSNQTSLRIEKVSKELNNKDITCEVSNSVGVSRKTVRLAVRYGPTFRIQPKDVYSKEGQNVTLSCLVDGSPKPTIVWLQFDNSTYIYGKGEHLTLEANAKTVGKYLCLAKVEGFTEISSPVGLFLKTPPKVKADNIQYGSVDDTAKIQCFVPASSPKSPAVKWVFKGRPVDTSSSKYEIEKEITADGLFVRLLIKGTKLEDFDSYSCSVHNDFGSDEVQITLQEKKKENLVMVAVLIFIGAAIIGGLAVVAMCYGKRNRQKNKEKKSTLPEKSLQITDQNSTGNDSDLKVELDNRTGSSMSTKDPEIDASWDKQIEDAAPNFISTGSTYIYPDTYGAIPMKINGHIGNNSSVIHYENYPDHQINASLSPLSQHTISGYTSGFSPRSQPLQTSSQLNLYPYQDDYVSALTQESVEGLRGLSSTIGNSMSNKGSSALHSSLSRPNGVSVLKTNTNTIPRLGIPVDPSQYIVPPRTQLLQGALATHV